MNTCFINGKELWFDGRAFGWKKESLKEIFRAVKVDQGIKEVRVVLGSEVSFVVAVRIESGEKITRAKALKIAGANLPFSPVDEGFDWQKISLGEGDEWLQIAAVEPDFLANLKTAAKSAGMVIKGAIPVAVVLARASLRTEAPILLKWNGKEKVSVLAIKGLVDLVGDMPDEKINAYARHKWHLAVNPEQMVLDESEFDFDKELSELNRKGGDSEIMEIGGVVRLGERGVREGVTVEMEGGGGWREIIRKFAPVMIVGILLVTLGIYVYQRSIQTGGEGVEQAVTTPTLVPEQTLEVATGSAQVGEPADFAINILNGSGITGEAARVRDDLIGLGYTNIHIGNAPAIARTTIAYKASVPAEILSKIVENMSEYEIGNLFALTSEKIYDVEIVIGRARKE